MSLSLSGTTNCHMKAVELATIAFASSWCSRHRSSSRRRRACRAARSEPTARLALHQPALLGGRRHQHERYQATTRSVATSLPSRLSR